MTTLVKPRVAVHKFSSCDGCQLAFLNLGPALLELNDKVELVHFLEAGLDEVDSDVDIAFIEGSVSTSKDEARLKRLRQQSRYLISIGACATSGGIQSLRNLANTRKWTKAIYASPEYIDSLDKVMPIASVVKVDFELWGCPVSSEQLVTAIRSLLLGVLPNRQQDKLCLECKRSQTICTLVTKGEACMGPLTRSGCGALCPAFGRDCYGCYGPAENLNTAAIQQCLAGLGLSTEAIHRRLNLIHSQPQPLTDKQDTSTTGEDTP